MKPIQFFLFFSALTFLSLACTPKESGSDYELTWSDEFDYSGFPDAERWDCVRVYQKKQDNNNG